MRYWVMPANAAPHLKEAVTRRDIDPWAPREPLDSPLASHAAFTSLKSSLICQRLTKPGFGECINNSPLRLFLPSSTENIEPNVSECRNISSHSRVTSN